MKDVGILSCQRRGFDISRGWSDELDLAYWTLGRFSVPLKYAKSCRGPGLDLAALGG